MINNSRKRITRRFSRLVKESNDILSKRRTRRSSLREGSNVDYPGVTIGKGSDIDKSVRIKENVTIGNNVEIRKGVVIGNNVVIEDNVIIGEDIGIEADSFVPAGIFVPRDAAFYDADKKQALSVTKVFNRLLPLKNGKSKFGDKFGIPYENLSIFQMMFINDESVAVEGRLIVDLDGDEEDQAFGVGTFTSSSWDKKGFMEFLSDADIGDYEEATVIDFEVEDGPIIAPDPVEDSTFAEWIDTIASIYKKLR